MYKNLKLVTRRPVALRANFSILCWKKDIY